MRYKDYVDVFSEDRAATLAPHQPTDHAIDLEPGFNLSYGQIYNLLDVKPKTLKAYIKTTLANGFIQPSSSAAAAPILVVKKKDGGLRLSVDYQALNSATVKNRYPLQLFSDMLNRLRGARIFTKLDLLNSYHLIRNKEGDKYQTEFPTQYGQFKYQVMLFVLTNAPAKFEAYMDHYLQPFAEDFAVCNLDNILIYLTNEEDHE